MSGPTDPSTQTLTAWDMMAGMALGTIDTQGHGLLRRGLRRAVSDAVTQLLKKTDTGWARRPAGQVGQSALEDRSGTARCARG